MAKRRMTTQARKKSIFGRWWFWLIILFAFFSGYNDAKIPEVNVSPSPSVKPTVTTKTTPYSTATTVAPTIRPTATPKPTVTPTPTAPPVAFQNSEFSIHFIDVGQGDAAVILCDGKVLMIDGGNSADSSLIYSYLRNTLNIQHIDYMIATHPHEDHIGGLAGALNACSVGTLFSPVTEYENESFGDLEKYAKKQGLSFTVPNVGDTFMLGRAKVKFISPVRMYENVNDLSIAVRIEFGKTSFLFAGDAEWDAEHDMVNFGYNLSSTLLKVNHHGSDISSSYVFLREVMPSYAVISVGKGNSYGHPTDDVLSRLKDAGAEVYRTDTHGDIICKSDGEKLTFITEKNVEVIEEKPVQTNEWTYILNTNTRKFHYPSCSSVKRMKESNKREFVGDRQELINKGYSPCGNCHP